MKRIIASSIFLFALSFIACAYAAGPASKYEVRIAKFELWNGTSWITAYE